MTPVMPTRVQDTPMSFKPPGVTTAVEERRQGPGTIENMDLAQLPVYEYGDGHESKPKVLILGSGWATTSLIKS